MQSNKTTASLLQPDLFPYFRTASFSPPKHSRDLCIPQRKWEFLCHTLYLGKYPFLLGPKGCGKSSVAMELADAMEMDYFGFDMGQARFVGMGMAMQGSGISGVDVGSATLKLNDEGVYTMNIGAADIPEPCIAMPIPTKRALVSEIFLIGYFSSHLIISLTFARHLSSAQLVLTCP